MDRSPGRNLFPKRSSWTEIKQENKVSESEAVASCEEGEVSNDSDSLATGESEYVSSDAESGEIISCSSSSSDVEMVETEISAEPTRYTAEDLAIQTKEETDGLT